MLHIHEKGGPSLLVPSKLLIWSQSFLLVVGFDLFSLFCGWNLVSPFVFLRFVSRLPAAAVCCRSGRRLGRPVRLCVQLPAVTGAVAGVATRRQGADSASSAGGSIPDWIRPAQAASAVAQVLQSSGNGGARSQASARAALGGGG